MTEECACFKPRTHHNYYRCYLGMDDTEGRYADVTLQKCKECQSIWLYYFLDYHWRRNGTRWYLGLVSPEKAITITRHNAIDTLNQLDWFFYGGVYYDIPSPMYKKRTKKLHWRDFW